MSVVVDSAEDQRSEFEKRRIMVMSALALGILLASLDQTVVGTSLPKIVASLGGLDRFSWLFSAYMLTFTVMIPLAGKMSDRYGRKSVFLFGMISFVGGSMACGLAENMDQLIFFRSAQGFGAGAMLPVGIATAADFYAPAERGKIQGAFGAVIGIGSVIGPFVGGFIVDNLTWRWVFYVNLPVGVAAILLTMVKFPSLVGSAKKPIDYLGTAAISTSLSTLILITVWGGTTYEWLSLEILLLAAVCAGAFASFVLIEARAEDPIVPIPLFRISVFSFSCASLCLAMAGMFAVIAYLPLFLQAVIGVSATYSGEVLIPLMLAVTAGSIAGGLLLKRTGYKIWLVVGAAISVVGLFLLSSLHGGSSTTDTMVFLLVTGLGLGLMTPNFMVAVQNVVDRDVMGAATSSVMLFRALGGTIGITVMGVVLNRRMTEEISRNLPTGYEGMLPSTDVNTLGNLLLGPAGAMLPEPLREGIRTALGESITYVFFISMFVVLAALVVTLFIKSLPLKSEEEYMRGRRGTE